MLTVLACFALTLLQVDAFAPTPKPTLTSSVPSKEFLRESEVKHGRVAMLALPTLAAISLFDSDPVTFLSRQSVSDQLTFFSTYGVLESALTLPRLGNKFSLKEGLVPGKIIPFKKYVPGKNLQQFEDLSGRAAMVVAFAILAQRVLMG